MKAPLACLIACLWLVADSPSEKDAVKKMPPKLDGTWTPTSLIYNGKDMTKNKKTQFRFVFNGDEAVVEGSKDVRKEYARLKVKLDPAFDPKIIDIMIGGGTQEGVKIEGIYKLADDELTICAKVFGGDRPTEFASPEGGSIVLLVLKRNKP
jgi:uncharacterized protein (TIGR03067 family)